MIPAEVLARAERAVMQAFHELVPEDKQIGPAICSEELQDMAAVGLLSLDLTTAIERRALEIMREGEGQLVDDLSLAGSGTLEDVHLADPLDP